MSQGASCVIISNNCMVISTSCVIISHSCKIISNSCVNIRKNCVVISKSCMVINKSCVIISNNCVVISNSCSMELSLRPIPGGVLILFVKTNTKTCLDLGNYSRVLIMNMFDTNTKKFHPMSI